MTETTLTIPRRRFGVTMAVVIALTASLAAKAEDKKDKKNFDPENLLVSRSVYIGTAGTVTIGTILPPGCGVPSGPNQSGACAVSVNPPKNGATNDGTYPTVFNNNLYDGSFGVTSPIFLDEMDKKTGAVVKTIEVPNSSIPGIKATSDQMVTSFSSKSELALNKSLNGKVVTFMGYLANVNAIDVSNSNTPGVIDPTNPVGEEVYRVVAEIDKDGEFHFTLTNAYSGNNGRAAILNDKHGANFVYTAGNAGNGGNPQPPHIISGTGTQLITPSGSPEIFQAPGLPTPVGSFNITQLGLPHDKIGKDTNFRGLTIHDNVIYLTKGSGGNGVNTVYFIDTTLAACPSTSATPGVGLPSKNAVLPAMGLPYVEGDLQTFGVRPYNMCILKGFPATLNSTNVNFPFGLFFADDNTLYVADEGTGDATSTGTALSNGIYTAAAAEVNGAASTTPSAGLQKWVFNPVAGSWEYVYTLQTGLNLGTPYIVAGYPTGLNTVKTGPKPNTLKPWAPATDGLRNIYGETDDGKVTIWGITSTVSGRGDQGADPNKLVKITDSLKNTDKTVALGETFTTVRTAASGEVLRGVSAVPGSDSEDDRGDE